MSRALVKLSTLTAQCRNRLHQERGDVPGWVLITLMTAGLVLLLWGVAGDTLVQIFKTSMERVGIIGK